MNHNFWICVIYTKKTLKSKMENMAIKWQAKNNANARDSGDEGSHTEARVRYGTGEGKCSRWDRGPWEWQTN